jgi:hypothetical protein
MAYIYINLSNSDINYIGVSTEDKPTGVDNGAKCYEYDTKKTYITHDGGTTWTEKSSEAGNIQVNDLEVSDSNPIPVRSPKASVATAINNVSETTTSSVIDARLYNSILLYIDVGSSWSVKITGCDTSDGTFKDCYDNNGNPLSSTNMTASKIQLFIGLPEYIKIVATEVSGSANCTVKYQLLNV